MIQRVVKWTGSKKTQAADIIKYMPKEIDTYYEPFVGGASVLMEVLSECESGNIRVNRFVACDVNRDLIGIYNLIKYRRENLKSYYKFHWEILNSLETEQSKSEYYTALRNDYNRMPDGEARYMAFFFLLRTCFNGLVRYNSKGEFNTAFHINRGGMKPDTLFEIIDEWSMMLNKYDVIFVCADYREVLSEVNENDFIYADPPYANPSNKMYFSDEFNNGELFAILGSVPCRYALSYNGKCNGEDYTFDVPDTIYRRHVYIDAKGSGFRKLQNCKTESIYESLYLNY